MIGGSGEKRSLRLVAQYADACNVNDVAHTENGLERVGGPELIAHKFDVVRGYCDELGRPFDEILRTHFTKSIVQFLGAVEEGRRALDLPPAGFDAQRIHHQGERGQDFRDTAPIERRVDVDDMCVAHAVSFLEYSLGGRSADQRLVLLERVQAKRGLVEGRRGYGHRLCLPKDEGEGELEVLSQVPRCKRSDESDGLFAGDLQEAGKATLLLPCRILALPQEKEDEAGPY
jgi:hypothetical protein